MSSFDRHGQIDIAKAPIVSCVGRKGSGKTVVALMLIESFPGDVVVIDVAGDDGPMGPGVIEWSETVEHLPRSFPTLDRTSERQRLILRYVPDAGSPTFLEDMDAVVGVALKHSTRERPTMLVIHEGGVLAKANRTPAHTRRVLMHSRHNGLVVVFTMPRALDIDPLVLAQSDVVYNFDLPNPHDKKRVAETIGWQPTEYAAAVDELAEHEYLRFDAKQAAPAAGEPDYRLIHFAPLPQAAVDHVVEWSKNVPADRSKAGVAAR